MLNLGLFSQRFIVAMVTYKDNKLLFTNYQAFLKLFNQLKERWYMIRQSLVLEHFFWVSATLSQIFNGGFNYLKSLLVVIIEIIICFRFSKDSDTS